MAKSNIGILNKIYEDIRKRAAKAVQMTRDEIYHTIQVYLLAWYGDYDPTMYKRTYKFANSLVKLDVDVIGNSIHTEVKIDEDYLNFHYPSGSSPTGLQVATSADKGYHGADGLREMSGETELSFWTQAIDEGLGGEAGIETLLQKNLKACGL